MEESQEKTLAYENDLLRLFLRIVTLFSGFFCRSYSVGSHRLCCQRSSSRLIRDSVEEINKILEPRHSLIVKEMTESEMKTAILQHELDLFISSSAFYRQMVRSGARDIVSVETGRGTGAKQN